MRHAVLSLLVVVLGVSATPAQETWGSKLFKETTHDFGNKPRGTQLYHRFEVSNPFKVPLEISTRVGCNCVTVTPQSMVLQPNEKDKYFEITMDATRFVGPKHVEIYATVTGGAQYMSSATLHLTANSRSDVVCNPGQIYFGVLEKGPSLQSLSLDVEYAGALNFKIEEIVKHTAPLEVVFKEIYRRPGQVGYRVTVTLKPDAPPGELRQELSLKTNDPGTPMVPVMVVATIKASLEVVPSTVNFGLMKVGEAKTLRVLVRGTKPFHILAVEGIGEGLTAKLPGNIAAVHFLQLDLQAGKAGDLKRQLKIKTDAEQGTVVTVAVEGSAAP